MKLDIFAHCTIDNITLEGSKYEQIGGSACYCGITARRFKFDVELHTKFGPDFPRQYLTEQKITFPNAQTETPTTRFAIDISGADRTLKLEQKCDNITHDEINADGVLVSPICGEITHETFYKIKKDSKFILVDPQGFLRDISQQKVTLKESNIDLANIDAIKVNYDEGKSLTGTSNDMLKLLQKKGIKHVILTNNSAISMLVKDKIYSITLPNKEIHDTTGIGDIFCSAFCCTILKEKDFLWALCFAGGAVQAALDSKNVGLAKIPKKGEVETNASYFYNLVKFQNI